LILKLGHIAINSIAPEQWLKELTEKGYELTFQEKKLKSLSVKKELLSKYVDHHELQFFEHPANYSIEVLNHHNDRGISSPIGLDFEVPFELKFDTWDKKASTKFWEQFGFKSSKEGFLFKGFLDKAPLGLVLTEKKERQEFKMDDTGPVFLAFLSNSAQRDLDAFKIKGYKVFDAEDLMVNNQLLSIGFVMGPCSEIVEIYSLAK